MAVGNVSNFLKELNKLPLDPNYVRFFRGHADLKWDLLPSLFRANTCITIADEVNILNEIKVRFPYEFNECQNILEILVKAQHYGIPTRLLDITSNPLVALYFAILRTKENTGNAIVYIFDIPKDQINYFDNRNLLSYLDNVMFGNCSSQNINSQDDIENYYFVKVRWNNPRIIRQFGAFILFLYSSPIDNSKFKCVEISASHIKQIKKELTNLCISKETLFPELSSYAGMLHEKDNVK